MKRTLKQLLRESEVDAGAPEVVARLGDQVRAALSRKRRTRRAVAACGLAVSFTSIAIVLFESTPSAPDRPPVALSSNAAPSSRISKGSTKPDASLDPQIRLQIQEKAAEILLADRPSLAREREARSAPSLDFVQRQRDRAALVLIYEADRYLRDERREAALAAYRRAIELFPQSQWATVAATRIKEIAAS